MLKKCSKRVLTLSYQDYYDKIMGGWLGKSLGGIIGAPYENHKQFNNVTRDSLWPAKLYPNDDLDIPLVWLEMLQEKGLYLDSIDMAKFWQSRCFYICCEYGVFINNLEHGIYPPLSGTWNNDFFNASGGCQIRAEIWGYICPGNPVLAAEYAAKDGCLDHGPVSIGIEQFLAAVSSLVFCYKDLDEVLDNAAKAVSPDCAAIEILCFVREVVATYSDKHDIWKQLVRRYGNRDGSKASMTLAIALVSLFLGKRDFEEVMQICVQYGWDTDSSAATAGALFGALYGSAMLPEELVKKMGATLVCACEIPHQYASFESISDETARIGVEMSLARNFEADITNAPEVVVRQKPVPKITISAEYPAAPVLWNSKKTPIILHVHNPGTKDFCGVLKIKAPADVDCSLSQTEVTLPAGGDVTIELNASSKAECEYLNDKNLFTAKLFSREGSIVCEHIFGLEAARLWKVYGPYWDMWDKDKYAVCPYQNEEIKCNPACISGVLDYFNHHVRFNHAYLDEDRLIHEDIHNELPFDIEVGGDKLNRSDICNFLGAGCYYLVRTVKSDKAAQDVICGVNRSAPCKVWFDGKLIEESSQYTCWAPELDDRITVDFTGKPQRLVIKIAANADNFTVSNVFVKTNPTKKCAVAPFFNNIAYLKNVKNKERLSNSDTNKPSIFRNIIKHANRPYTEDKLLKKVLEPV